MLGQRYTFNADIRYAHFSWSCVQTAYTFTMVFAELSINSLVEQVL